MYPQIRLPNRFVSTLIIIVFRNFPFPPVDEPRISYITASRGAHLPLLERRRFGSVFSKSQWNSKTRTVFGATCCHQPVGFKWGRKRGFVHWEKIFTQSSNINLRKKTKRTSFFFSAASRKQRQLVAGDHFWHDEWVVVVPKRRASRIELIRKQDKKKTKANFNFRTLRYTRWAEDLFLARFPLLFRLLFLLDDIKTLINLSYNNM